MKLIDVDSKATLEDFLTLKKKTELIQFRRKCKKIFSPFIKKRIWFFSLHERSKTRQDKFENILEIIESFVSSPFVKAEADSVEYIVLCLKRSVRLP
jgi:hypothetical protein